MEKLHTALIIVFLKNKVASTSASIAVISVIGGFTFQQYMSLQNAMF